MGSPALSQSDGLMNMEMNATRKKNSLFKILEPALYFHKCYVNYIKKKGKKSVTWRKN